MKIIFKIHKFIFILCFAMLLQHCTEHRNQQDEKNAEKGKFSVTDFRGKKLYFEKPVTRAVCLIESALTGIYMLGAQEHVVGISSNIYSENLFKFYSKMDSRIAKKSLPTPGNWDFVNLEEIVSLKSDLVIIWASQNESIENIEKFGIPVYGVMLYSLDDIYKEINDFGVLFGKENRSDNLVNFTKKNLEKIAIKTKGQNKEKVYFAWMQGITETSGNNSLVNEVIESSGGKNVCDNENEHVVVNLEKIVEWNPNAIVLWKNDKINPPDILQMSSLKNVNAIKTGSVFEFPSSFECDFWTLKFQYSNLLLASWLYPELFTKEELATWKMEIFQELYHSDFIFSHEE